MKYITLGEILILHDYQIERFGGRHGILNSQILESCVFKPQTVLYQEELYPSVFDKAAVLAMSIIQFHPFVDGNKRTGIYSALIFLEINGYDLKISNRKLVSLTNKIAGKDTNLRKIAKVFEEFCTNNDKKIS